MLNGYRKFNDQIFLSFSFSVSHTGPDQVLSITIDDITLQELHTTNILNTHGWRQTVLLIAICQSPQIGKCVGQFLKWCLSNLQISYQNLAQTYH